jgi:outer membrane protein assembly factor BamB
VYVALYNTGSIISVKDGVLVLDLGQYGFDYQIKGSLTFDGNGILYAVLESGFMLSLNLDPLESITGWVLSDSSVSSPAIFNGTVYITDYSCLSAIGDRPDRPMLDSPFATYRGDKYRTGLSAFDGPERGVLSLQFTIGAQIVATPVIDNSGHLYLGDSGGNFFSLTAAGSIRWRNSFDDEFASSATLATHDRLYVSGFFGEVYAFTTEVRMYVLLSNYICACVYADKLIGLMLTMLGAG